MVISAADTFGAAGRADIANPLHPSATSGTAAASIGTEELPLVDRTVLEDLEEQLGRPDVAWNFAKDYLALWGQREHRLVDSLERGDQAAAIDAAISLKVSSAMVGGLRLAVLAQLLEAALRDGNLRQGASILALISIQGPATVNELQRRCLRRNG